MAAWRYEIPLLVLKNNLLVYGFSWVSVSLCSQIISSIYASVIEVIFDFVNVGNTILFFHTPKGLTAKNYCKVNIFFMYTHSKVDRCVNRPVPSFTCSGAAKTKNILTSFKVTKKKLVLSTGAFYEHLSLKCRFHLIQIQAFTILTIIPDLHMDMYSGM